MNYSHLNSHTENIILLRMLRLRKKQKECAFGTYTKKKATAALRQARSANKPFPHTAGSAY